MDRKIDMIRHIIVPLFLLLVLLSINTFAAEPKVFTSTDIKVERCNIICTIADGDKMGILVNGQCGCWNPRDISKYVFRINRQAKVEILFDQKQKGYDE